MELRLTEHEVAADVRLTPHEVAWLRQSDAGLTILATGKPGLYDVKASERVGVLVGASRNVVIEPKVAVGNLLFLLGGAESVKFGESSAVGADASIADAMGTLYAELLEGAIRRGGLVSSYKELRDELSAPRGRIDWLRVRTKRFGLFPPIECVVSDLDPDSELNRRLLAALVAMSRATSVHVSSRLRALMGHFVGVADARYPNTPLPSVVLDRRTERFRRALSLAEAILGGFSVTLRAGHVLSPSFIIDMNDVFERFVIRELDGAVRTEGRRVVHHPEGLFLDRGRRLALKPDGVLYDRGAGHAVAVIDAKYKRSGAGFVEDTYQAFAYCTALGITRGLLVYAGARDTLHEIVNSEVRVLVVGLDLSRDPRQLRERLSDLAGILISPRFAAA